MPELPEVEALALFLHDRLAGEVIDRADLMAVSALKTYDPPLKSLAGRSVAGVGRAGKFLLVDTDGLWLVMHLARAGWIRWRDSIPSGPPPRARKTPLALRLRLASGGGIEVTEQGTEKRLAVYVAADPRQIEGVERLGPDPLDPAFDRDALASVLAGRNAQLKGVLTDQELIAGVGNAYSDDILHAARLSPFKAAGKLTDDEIDRLWTALHEVLTDAVHRSAGLPAKGLKQEKRAGMRVHGRAGQACPVCGDDVREVSFATSSLQYCATCQTGGKPLADRRFSRLVK